MGDNAPAHVEGWRNQQERLVLLAFGWLVLGGGLVLGAVGWALHRPAVMMAGLGAASVAWLTAQFLPDPEPADRLEIRERRERLAKLDGHQLPV